jgi:hypothetical protein
MWGFSPSEPEVECDVYYESQTSWAYTLYDANYDYDYVDTDYNYCETTNNYVPNLTPTQVQACVDSLLAVDAAAGNLCGYCTGPTQACMYGCYNNPGGQDDGTGCY